MRNFKTVKKKHAGVRKIQFYFYGHLECSDTSSSGIRRRQDGSRTESTPHANTMIYNSTYEGAQPIADFARDTSVVAVDAITRKRIAKMQTGKEVPLRPTSGQILPESPWPKGGGREQGDSLCWDQYDDSLSTASASASTRRKTNVQQLTRKAQHRFVPLFSLSILLFCSH